MEDSLSDLTMVEHSEASESFSVKLYLPVI